MKTLGYILAALVGYKLLTGKQLIAIPVAGTVQTNIAPMGATALPDSQAVSISGGNGTLTGINAPANGSQQYYATTAGDPAASIAAFVPSQYDGAAATVGVFTF